MRFSSIRRAAVTLGAVAALAAGTGLIPGVAGSTSSAQAAELAQPADHHRHHGGHHGGWHGHRFHARHNFSHAYWGWGYHRLYPTYYVSYAYEPVSVCGTYYFDEESATWFCFVGS